MPTSRLVAALVGVLAVVAVVVVASTRSSDDHAAGADRSSTSTTVSGEPAPSGDPGAGAAAGAEGSDATGSAPNSGVGDRSAGTAPATTSVPPGAYVDPVTGEVDTDVAQVGTAPIPADLLPVSVDVTAGRGPGSSQTLQVRVTADPGSYIYGIEARLCAGGVDIAYDADIRPTQTGKCVTEPLAPDTDDRIEVASAPPNQVAELTFRAGTGTNRYTTQGGRDVTITCDVAHPCTLALKLQVPNGFGFETRPISFA